MILPQPYRYYKLDALAHATYFRRNIWSRSYEWVEWHERPLTGFRYSQQRERARTAFQKAKRALCHQTVRATWVGR